MRVAVSFAPVQPSGWPRAMAPPLGFTRVGSSPACWITARDWAPKASLSSITAMSLRERPASFSALGMAKTGPMPNSSGGQPAVA